MLTDEELDAIEKYAATNTDAAPVDYTARLVAEVRSLRTAAANARPAATKDAAYFRKRVDEWREMPILGHGLWARYQNAHSLLDDALRLLGESLERAGE